jgi:hypothetical protein
VCIFASVVLLGFIHLVYAAIYMGVICLTAPRPTIDLAAMHRSPAMFDARVYAEIGDLMAYGPNLPDSSLLQ